MQAVIMAGGKGTRLRALTGDRLPKPMAPVLGRPVLQWQIERLLENDISDIIIITGHLGEQIREYFGGGDRFGVSVRYLEEKKPLGTAGSLYGLENMLDGSYFLLVFGDVLFDIDIARMERFHVEKRSVATLFVHPNSHPYDSDLVIVDGAGKVTGFDSKEHDRTYWYDNCVNAGFYILNREVCGFVKRPVKTDLEKDVLTGLIRERQAVYAYRSPEYCKDVGTVERIAEAAGDLRSGRAKDGSLRYCQQCIFIACEGIVTSAGVTALSGEDLFLTGSAAEALRMLNGSGYLGIVITRQPAFAGGPDTQAVEAQHNRLKTVLGRQGVYLDDVVCCPARMGGESRTGQPAVRTDDIGIDPAADAIADCCRRFHVDRNRSWMVGNCTEDIRTGKNAGLGTVLVGTGKAGSGAECDAAADHVCESLLEAVQIILNAEGDTDGLQSRNKRIYSPGKGDVTAS